MVTVLLPFLPKTSDPNYTTLTTFDSVKMEGRAPQACGIAGDVPSASQSSALHVGAHESEDFIRAIRGSEKISRKSLKKY
jgi:hypothetical protein